MSENNPWKKVGTYVADICLDDGDMIDVDVCLRTEVDAARAAEATQHQQEIAEKDAEIDRCDSKIDALRICATDLRARLAAVEAERDRLKAALDKADEALKRVTAGQENCGDPGAECPLHDAHKTWHPVSEALAMIAALSGKGTAKP